MKSMVALLENSLSTSKTALRARGATSRPQSRRATADKSCNCIELGVFTCDACGRLGSCSNDPIGYLDELNLHLNSGNEDLAGIVGGYSYVSNRSPARIDPLGLQELGPTNGVASASNCNSIIEVGYNIVQPGWGAVSFFLLAYAESKNCCDFDVLGFDENKRPFSMGIMPISKFPYTDYIYGWVKVSRQDREQYRKKPTEECECPCRDGVECERRKYVYTAKNPLEKAFGMIEITVCADGSYAMSGYGRERAFFAFKDYDEFKHVYQQKTCQGSRP